MHIIQSANNFNWIIGTIRVPYSGKRIKQRIHEYSEEHKLPWLTIDDNKTVSFSTYEGQDFGLTIQSYALENGFDRYLYVDKRLEGYVFVVIENQIIIEERIISDDEKLLNSLALLNDERKYNSLEPYVVECIGLSASDEIISAIDLLTEGGGERVNLLTSHVDSLLYSVDYSFNAFEDVQKNLQNTKLQFGVFLSFLFLLLIGGGTYYYQQNKVIERVKTVDNYTQMRSSLTNLPSASLMLAQDFNMQLLMRRELIGWNPYRVTYSPESIIYDVSMDSVFHSSIDSLNDFAANNNIGVRHDQEGSHLIVPSLKVAPFPSENEVKTFSMAQVAENVVDVTNQLTPFISFRVDPSRSGNGWGHQNITALFAGAENHDLARLGAVLDGFPHRYPIVVAEKSSYTINASGEYAAGIKFQIIGE
jgi:hypothetical protein